MSDRTKWRAVWGVLAIVAVFALIVFSVEHYGDYLEKINWSLVSLICIFVFGGYMVYRWNEQLARYNVIELVMNPTTGKPDPYRHLLFVFAGLTVWAVIQVVLAEEWGSLTAVLLPSLGYFVAKPTIDGISAAIASRPAASSEAGGNLQINAPNADTVNVPPRVAAEAATDVGQRRPASAIKTLKA